MSPCVDVLHVCIHPDGLSELFQICAGYSEHTSLDLEHGGQSTQRSRRFVAHADFDSTQSQAEERRFARQIGDRPAYPGRRLYADNVMTTDTVGDNVLRAYPHGLTVGMLTAVCTFA